MREIILGANQRYTTLVSDEDYDWLVKWRWQYKLSASRFNQRVYAKRTTTVESRKVTLLMSHVILIDRMGHPRPGEDYDADHADGDALNNQRDNLSWKHKTVNRGQNRRWATPVAQEAAHG